MQSCFIWLSHTKQQGGLVNSALVVLHSVSGVVVVVCLFLFFTSGAPALQAFSLSADSYVQWTGSASAEGSLLVQSSHCTNAAYVVAPCRLYIY